MLNGSKDKGNIGQYYTNLKKVIIVALLRSRMNVAIRIQYLVLGSLLTQFCAIGIGILIYFMRILRLQRSCVVH